MCRCGAGHLRSVGITLGLGSSGSARPFERTAPERSDRFHTEPADGIHTSARCQSENRVSADTPEALSDTALHEHDQES